MERHEFKHEVRQRIGDENGSLLEDSDANLWLNFAIRYIWKQKPWPFIEKLATNLATVSGTQAVTMPSDFVRVRKLRNQTSEYLLAPKPRRWLEDVYDTSDKGEPLFYTHPVRVQALVTDAVTFKTDLYPIPDAVYTLYLHYQSSAPSLTGDGDVSPLPADFDEAILLWILQRYYRKLDDFSQVADHRAEYEAEIQKLWENYGDWQAEQYPVIHPLPEFDTREL